MEKEKLVVVDFYEYMSLLENCRKLDIKCRDLQKTFCNILSAIGEVEDREITKTEFFYLINDILIEHGGKR